MKNYRFILITFLCTEFGRAMYFVTITWLLYQTTENATYTGFFISLGFVPGLIANLYIGVIVDCLSKKKICLISLASNGIAIGLLFGIHTIGLTLPWLIFLVHMIQQLLSTLFKAAAQAYIAEIFVGTGLPKVFSHSNASAIIGSLLGAGLGGVLSSFTNGKLSLLLVMTTYFIGYYCIFRLDYSKQIHVLKTTKIKKQLQEGFTYLTSNTQLFRLFGIMFVGQLTFHSTIGFLSIYTIKHLHQSTIVYGFLDTFLSIGGVVAGLLGTWWWRVRKWHLASNAVIIMIVGIILLSFTQSVLGAFVGVALIGVGTTWIRVLLQSVQQIITNKAYHGRMSSYRMLCNQSAVVISGPMLGWLATHHGITSSYCALLIPGLFALSLTLQPRTLSILRQVTV